MTDDSCDHPHFNPIFVKKSIKQSIKIKTDSTVGLVYNTHQKKKKFLCSFFGLVYNTKHYTLTKKIISIGTLYGALRLVIQEFEY